MGVDQSLVDHALPEFGERPGSGVALEIDGHGLAVG